MECLIVLIGCTLPVLLPGVVPCTSGSIPQHSALQHQGFRERSLVRRAVPSNIYMSCVCTYIYPSSWLTIPASTRPAWAPPLSPSSVCHQLARRLIDMFLQTPSKCYRHPVASSCLLGRPGRYALYHPKSGMFIVPRTLPP
jgi:hypothetical protein